MKAATAPTLEFRGQAILEEGLRKVRLADLARVVAARPEILRLLRQPGPLQPVAVDAESLLALLEAHVEGRYVETPLCQLAAGVAAFQYLLDPVDVVPDMIPGAGQADDAAVLGACLQMTRRELAAFREQKH